MIDLSRPELAVNGGACVRGKPWADNFTLGSEERDAVLRVLDSGYLSKFEGSHTPDPPFSFYGGPEVQELESDWARFYTSPFCISMNSATSCLFASIGALEIGYGDEVIVSPFTMSACAIAPLLYGAIPVFADVEEETGCLDPVSVEKKISNRTKAILVVHQFGIPAKMDQLCELAKKYDLRIIEDCAQAHGAKIGDQFVGTFGDIGVFSLNVNKTIQSGEGGICITGSEEIAYRLALIRNHGEAVVGPAGYKNIVNILGFNFRLTEIQAAIGREQLKKVDILNERRLELLDMLIGRVNHLRPDLLRILPGRSGCTSTYYLCPMIFDETKSGVARHEFIAAMVAEGINLSGGYVKPLYFQPIYQEKTLFKNGYPFSAPENSESNCAYLSGLCPISEKLHFHELITSEHIRFPHTGGDIADIIKAFEKVIG